MEAPASPAVRGLSGALLLLGVAVLSCTKLRDSDAWWQIKTGAWILEHGIPRTDPFSYVLEGRPWVVIEWLSQVLFYVFFRLGGAWGLFVLKAGVLGASFGALWRSHRARPLWAAVVLSAAALAARGYFVERPFLFDYLLLAVLLSGYWDVRFRAPSPRLLWGLPLLTALWANLHGGAAILAPGLTALAVAAERWRDPQVPLRFWGKAILFSCLALLVNPQGPAILTHLRETLAFPGKELLADWHAPFAHDFKGLYGVFLAGGLWAVIRLYREKPFAAAWVLATAAASLGSRRHIPLFLLAAASLIAELNEKRFKIKEYFAFPAWIALWVYGFFATPYLAKRFGIGIEAPLEGAASFVEEADLKGPLFNEYESGGYLIWRLAPERKVFMDGRNMEYGPEHFRAALAWYQPGVWRALDSRWSFAYALVTRHITGAYTAQVLEEDPGWRPVYWDDEAMVYAKRNAENEALIRRYGYALLQPGRTNFQYLEPFLEDAADSRRLLAELDRSVSEARGGAINALLLKAYVLLRLRRSEEAVATALEAVRLRPDRAQPRFTLGWLRSAAGDLPGAAAEYRKALTLVGADERPGLGADIQNNLGILMEKGGDLGAARRYYRQSLRWNPRQGDAQRNLERLR